MVGKFSTIEPCLPLKGSISQTTTLRIKFAMHELEGSHLNHMRHPNVEEPGQSGCVFSVRVFGYSCSVLLSFFPS